ncbi:unnamed protein product [Meloidogyne enterolobii]|uniref:Uncharacterized protein n=1 Tax=Meloidogyne enterolobii TaxID=390850 RepID=A0ACB0ZDP0_MELEN
MYSFLSNVRKYGVGREKEKINSAFFLFIIINTDLLYSAGKEELVQSKVSRLLRREHLRRDLCAGGLLRRDLCAERLLRRATYAPP